MSEKQIIIDYKNICENYSKEVGCYNTFDGSCIKEQCFTYKLLQLLKAKEQECEKIKNWVKGMMFYTDCSNWFERFTTTFEDWKNDLISQLDQLKTENKELKKTNKHIEHNRSQKTDKLMRIEKLIITCSTDYTDEFIQELLVILHEPEPNSFENKHKTTLTEIKKIAENSCCLQPTSDCEEYENCKECSRTSDDETVKQILQKISEVLNDSSNG